MSARALQCFSDDDNVSEKFHVDDTLDEAVRPLIDL